MKYFRNKIVALFSASLFCSSLYAATPVDLSQQSPNLLQSLSRNSALTTKPIRESIDFNQTKHARLQQIYKGYPVHGADFIVHTKTGRVSSVTMNGFIYENLDQDLNVAPATKTGEQALTQAIADYQKKSKNMGQAKNTQSNMIVFVDKDNKAHWAYHVQFYVDAPKVNAIPAKPNFIIDANDLTVYKYWNNIQTAKLADVDGGGYGGNEKMGRRTYDGLFFNGPKLTMERNSKTKTCYLNNDDVAVEDARSNYSLLSFSCNKPNIMHNFVYWDGEQDAVNGGYSPGNDALYGGMIIKDMYQKWFGVPVLTEEDGATPMVLRMRVHDYIGDNAYWDGQTMNFGDGESYFYPLTSLGVAAHEISHGFTEQHSNLDYYEQSGGMNEAFSDMAAQAAEFYAYGKNSWEIGPEIVKGEGALRYMEQPSKDCASGQQPGDWCSIDNATQYSPSMDPHFTSGVYNRAFYLLGTADGWNPKKAFEVMAHANRYYWTTDSTYEQGACGVLQSAKDYGYPVAAIMNAFNAVKVDISKCGK